MSPGRYLLVVADLCSYPNEVELRDVLLLLASGVLSELVNVHLYFNDKLVCHISNPHFLVTLEFCMMGYLMPYCIKYFIVVAGILSMLREHRPAGETYKTYKPIKTCNFTKGAYLF